MHPLVENYGDCGLDEEIEAVKEEWWNVVTEEFMGVFDGGEEGMKWRGVTEISVWKQKNSRN